LGITAAQATFPADTCQAAKNKIAGQYAFCRQKVEATLAKIGGMPDYSKCDTKFGQKWMAAETTANGQCPTTGDAASIQTRISTDSSDLAVLLSGGSAPVCGNGVIEGGEQCDFNNLNGQTCQSQGFVGGGQLSCTPGTCTFDTSGCLAAPVPVCGNGVVEGGVEECDFNNLDGQTCQTQGFVGGQLSCTPGTCVFDTSGCFATRFVDNGDGTVTDHQTGLQWEKKDNLDNMGFNPADPHDADNQYTLSASGTAPDGTAYTDFLAKLNDGFSLDGNTITGCFAGHCDWRLPTSAELQTIVDLNVAGCGTFPYPPCIDPAFGPTQSGSFSYWSATSFSESDAWIVDFSNGSVSIGIKTAPVYYARAVRNAPTQITDTCAPAPCAAGTVNNCTLPTTDSGNSNAGTCPAGDTGSCSFSCSNGTWTQITDSCAPAPCAAGTVNNCTLPTTNSGNSDAGTCPAGDTGSCSFSCSNGTWTQITDSCAPAPCAAGTVNNCTLTTTNYGSSDTGTCAAGYTGSCSFACTNGGTWTQITDTCAPAPCAAGTVNNCTLPTTNSGNSNAGTCPAGDTGSCSFSCSNGTWTQITDSCAP
jgi:hypothetical protein